MENLDGPFTFPATSVVKELVPRVFKWILKTKRSKLDSLHFIGAFGYH